MNSISQTLGLIKRILSGINSTPSKYRTQLLSAIPEEETTIHRIFSQLLSAVSHSHLPEAAFLTQALLESATIEKLPLNFIEHEAALDYINYTFKNKSSKKQRKDLLKSLVQIKDISGSSRFWMTHEKQRINKAGFTIPGSVVAKCIDENQFHNDTGTVSNDKLKFLIPLKKTKITLDVNHIKNDSNENVKMAKKMFIKDLSANKKYAWFPLQGDKSKPLQTIYKPTDPKVDGTFRLFIHDNRRKKYKSFTQCRSGVLSVTLLLKKASSKQVIDRIPMNIDMDEIHEWHEFLKDARNDYTHSHQNPEYQEKLNSGKYSSTSGMAYFVYYQLAPLIEHLHSCRSQS